MRIRAIIFDIYKTLIEVGPPPPDAAARWQQLWRNKLSSEPRLTLEAFSDECTRIIAREHATARAFGIAFPEICWAAVAVEALPELGRLQVNVLDEFLFAHAQTQRTLHLATAAARELQSLARRETPLGLVSNCQPYTLHELDGALESVKLSRAIFQPDLCFLSFQCGFSKPDPHVFRFLSARLQERGIPVAKALVVGDRLDNDIEPAHAQGWQTWHLASVKSTWPTSGDWTALSQFLSANQ